MRKNVLSFSSKIAFLILTALPFGTHAQTYIPPNAANYSYDGGTLYNLYGHHVDNYSQTSVATAYGPVDLYLSTWTSQPGGEFVWQFTAPGDPNNIINQGTVPYTYGRDMAVGAVMGSGGIYLLVAYCNNNNIMLDIYLLTGSMTAPVLYNTMTLASNTYSERISMDCHKGYGVAVTWKSTAGIQIIVSNSTTFGNVMTLTGTQDAMFPDVAFSHSASNPLNVHMVYYFPNANKIIESVLDWNAMLSTPPGYIAPVIEDANPIPASFFRYVWPVIDCPDHYTAENWAYTYTCGATDYLHMAGIFVRHHSTTTATTNVVNGSIGITPCINHSPVSPALYYGEGGMGQPSEQIYVGWYNQPNSTFSNGLFVGMQLDENGTPISQPDYLVIPNPINSFNVNTTPMNWFYDFTLNLISFSKMSDPGISPQFIFTNYFYSDQPTQPASHLNHVFHKWGNVAFKSPNNIAIHPECGTNLPHAARGLSMLKQDIAVYPNPVKDNFNVVIPIQTDGIAHFQLYGMSGRLIRSFDQYFEEGVRVYQIDRLSDMSPGNYMLHISMNGQRIGSSKIVKQ